MSTTVHDSGYKRLFTNKTIFRQLIETFVEEDWVPKLFINWLRQLANYGKINPTDFERMEAHYRTREEMKSMLVKALEQERNNLRQEGYDIGEQKGIEKGIEKGIIAQRQTLLRLLQWKFALNDEILVEYSQLLAQIQQIDPLLQLLDRLLTAATVVEFDATLRAYLPKPAPQN